MSDLVQNLQHQSMSQSKLYSKTFLFDFPIIVLYLKIKTSEHINCAVFVTFTNTNNYRYLDYCLKISMIVLHSWAFLVL